MIREPQLPGGLPPERHFGAAPRIGPFGAEARDPKELPAFGAPSASRVGVFTSLAGPPGSTFGSGDGLEGAVGPDDAAASTKALQIGPFVDIFLSAGSLDDWGASCDATNQGNCGLYRVRWDLGSERATEVVRLGMPLRSVAGMDIGLVEVAAGSGEQLAWLYRGFAERGGEHGERASWLTYWDGKGLPRSTPLDEGTDAPDRPQWPFFYDDTTLVYEKADQADDMRTLWRVNTDGSGREALIGKNGTQNRALIFGRYTADVSYGNPQVDHSEATPRIVSFGPDESSALPVPHVTTIDGRNREDFDATSVYKGFTSPQHPSWSHDGKRIIAMRHEVPYRDGDGRFWRRLYSFERSSLGVLGAVWPAWRPTGLTFEPLPFADMSSVFTVNPCTYLTFKFARFCGDDNHIVATVYCSDADKNVEASRVLLIDIRDPAKPVYHDLTDRVRQAFPDGYTRDRWRAIFPACRSVT